MINNNIPPDLALLLGPRSWLLFSLLGLKANQDWLGLPPKYWNLITDYCIARDFCLQLEVVNDSAERGIQLVVDFANMTDNEEQYQFLLQ